MVKDWVRFESIEIDRDGYFITYHPIFTGDQLAVLIISIYEEMGAEKVAIILENEFNYWIDKYPTPLMVMASNKTKAKINIKECRSNDYIIGYPSSGRKAVMKWDKVPDEEYSHFDLSNNALFSIYEGLDYKTSEEVKVELSKKISDKKKLIFIMVFWFSVIPALIAYYGWANPVISFLALVYSLYVALRKGGEITGHIKPTQEALKNAEEEREKSHHHYHCKRNPDAFLKLKLENFKKDSEERLKSKIEELRS